MKVIKWKISHFKENFPWEENQKLDLKKEEKKEADLFKNNDTNDFVIKLHS